MALRNNVMWQIHILGNSQGHFLLSCMFHIIELLITRFIIMGFYFAFRCMLNLIFWIHNVVPDMFYLLEQWFICRPFMVAPHNAYFLASAAFDCCTKPTKNENKLLLFRLGIVGERFNLSATFFIQNQSHYLLQ